MAHRERFRAVLRGERPDRIPVVARLDLWHNAAAADGALPEECRGLTIPQIEARLGMGRSARFREFHRPVFAGAQSVERVEGIRRCTELTLAGRTLRQVFVRTPDQERVGIRGHIEEYFCKGPEDYDALAAAWESMRWETQPERFEAFDREIAADGLPLLVLGAIPIHHIMLAYAGYENFYLHWTDFPERIERLLRIMEARYEELWRAVVGTSAEIILHGAHWSSEMTPPPIFRRCFLPYYRRFSDFLHRAGKRCVFHADSDLSALLPEVLESGADVADCFACAPLVRLTFGEARRAWGDRVTIWGAIPSTILLPSCPYPEFRAYLDALEKNLGDGRALILAVSDNLMPGSEWGRIVEVCDRAKAWVRNG